MFVKIAEKESIEINGVKYPLRFEIDDNGNAVIATTRVDTLGFNMDSGLYQVETRQNVETFTKEFSVEADSYNSITFDELRLASTNGNNISHYRYMDFHVYALNPHAFSWADPTGFRSLNSNFGEFTAVNEASIKNIADIFYLDSSESTAGDNHKYLAGIGVRIVQSAFQFVLKNNSSEEQTYYMELRLYK